MTLLWRIVQVAWPFLNAVISRFFQHEGTVLAGYMSFAAMLAILPFLLFSTALAGVFIGPAGVDEAVNQLFLTLPPTVAQTLEPVVRDIAIDRKDGLLTLAALGALYAAANGAEAVRVALDRAYEADIPRGVLLHYVFSLSMVLLGFATFAILAVLIILAPLVYDLLQAETEFELPFGARVLRYVVALPIFGAFLWFVHRVLPSRRMRGFRIWPGILTTIVIWVTAAGGFAYYLSQVGTYAVTYGTLAGVMVTLIFFYITAVAIIFGGEVNAVVNAQRLATVYADERVLAAVEDAGDPERATPRGSRPRPRAPETAIDRLEQARSPVERAEASEKQEATRTGAGE